METTGKAIVIVIVLIGIAMGISAISMNYKWDRDYETHWSLADKSSTLTAKRKHIEAFVEALEKAGLKGQHDAALLKTGDNSFDKNYEALITLRGRLQEMEEMDPNSMAYQKAMEQVTEQEQGEAEEMLNVFKGCWKKEHYWYLWSWWCVIIVISLIVGLLIGLWKAGWLDEMMSF